MRNINDDGRKFTNRMEHEESKKNILFYKTKKNSF